MEHPTTWNGQNWNFFQEKFNGYRIQISQREGKTVYQGRKEDYSPWFTQLTLPDDTTLDCELIAKDNQASSVSHYMKERKYEMLQFKLFAVPMLCKFIPFADQTNSNFMNNFLQGIIDQYISDTKLFSIATAYPKEYLERFKQLNPDSEGEVLKEFHLSNWYKLVNDKMADVIITGYSKSYSLGTNFGNIAKLNGSQYNEEGKLVEVASIGTGLTEEMRLVEPGTLLGKIAEVKYRDKTVNGQLRFCAFQRWREDKDEKECKT